MTKSIEERVVKKLSRLPLKRLRKMQDIIRAQMEIAAGKKMDRAVITLQERDEQVTQAIDLKVFGKDDAKREAKKHGRQEGNN